MSDPPNLGDNRFAVLADAPHPKKKRTSQNILEIFPELPVIQKPDPKYVILSAVGVRNIQEYSCFSVHRALKLVCNDILSVSELRDGNLLILTGSKKSADKLILTKNLPGVCDINCQYHQKLNSSKGTIYAPYLNNVPENEIVSELNSQGVIEVYKYQKRTAEDKLSPCGVVLLTFDRYSTPDKLDISWHKVKVRPYYPNPMRCKSCQRLGHTKKWCNNTPLCETCALPPHTPTECTRTFCINCSENHASNYKECKVFKQHKEILKIKTKEKCTLKVAKEKYASQTTTTPLVHTFSDVITKSNTINTANPTNKNTKFDTLSAQNQKKTESLKIHTLLNDKTEITLPKNNTYTIPLKECSQQTKITKLPTKTNITKALPTIVTRSMTKLATNNQSASTSVTTKIKETLNNTQNKDLALPKQITQQITPYNIQEKMMLSDEE